MTADEFDQLVDQSIGRGEGKMTLPTFLRVISDIAAQAQQREVELSGRLVNGVVTLDNPDPLVVERNTIYVSDSEVKLKLRVEDQ